jgi:hypothetical protein
MTMNLKSLTAKLFVKNRKLYSGTAWICSDRYVLTAAHCVVDLKNPEVYMGPFRLLFPWKEIVSDEIVWLDPVLDVALLGIDPNAVAEIADEIKQLRSNPKPGKQANENKEWSAYGFPFANQTGLTIDGTISDYFAKITERSTPAIQLLCNQGGFLANYDSEGQPVDAGTSKITALTGASGGAVVHDGEIIGIVRSGPPKLGNKVVFATPLDVIAERSSQVAELLQQHRDNHIESIRRHWLSWEANDVRPKLVKDSLEGRPNVVHVPSQIYYLWNQFITERPWHEDIANRLSPIRTDAAEVSELAWLVEKIDRIDLSRTYRQISIDFDDFLRSSSGQVKELVRKLEDRLWQSKKYKDPIETQISNEKQLGHVREVSSGLYKISSEFDPPLYRRCFLITGSSGAGKTHFIAQLLAQGEFADREVLFLPLMSPSKVGTIEELLLSCIREASGETDWTDVEEFCALLAQRRSGDAPGSNERPLKLVVAIDDLDKWIFLRGDDFYRELTDFIAGKTNLHNLFWVLNYHNANYDQIAGDRFWPEYAAVRALPRTSVAETEYHSTNLGGWYVLDGFNEARKVGLDIIRVAQDNVDDAETDEPDPLQARVRMLQFVDPGGATLRNLSNPFIAWIIADLVKDAAMDWSTLDLHFVEFVDVFWDKRKQNLAPVLANSKINSANLSIDDLNRLVWIVAKALSQFPDLYPGRSALIKEAVKLGEQFSLEHRDQKSIESTISILNQGNLLRSITKTGSLGLGLPPEQKIEILIETFWEYFIASSLIEPESISAVDAEAIWDKLQTIATRKDIREGISTFFLLLLAKASTEPAIANFLEEFLKLGTESEKPLSASIWFAGQRGHADFQRKLAELAHQQPPEFSDPHTLYAFMVFVGDCSSQVLPPIDRLKLLKPYYRRIQEFAFSEVYYFVVRRIARRLTTATEARQLMEVFTECEEMDCAPQLARLTVRVLRNVFLYDQKKMLDLVLAYLQDLSNSKNVPAEVPFGKGKPYFYRELLTRELCERLVHAIGDSQKAYDLLVTRGWYDPTVTGIAEPIASEMQQQANISFGHWFRTRGEVDPIYVKLVRRLSKGNQHEKEIAFYLIRHTVSMKGPQNILVAYALRPILRKLYKNPQMTKFVDTYRQFFAVNLKRSKRTVKL